MIDEDRAGVLERLSSQGAERIRPLFPGEEDSELFSMFVVDVPDGGNSRKVLRELEASRVVQYAEEAEGYQNAGSSCSDRVVLVD